MKSTTNNRSTRLRRYGPTLYSLLAYLLLVGMSRCNALPLAHSTGFSGQIVDESGHGLADAYVFLRRLHGSSVAEIMKGGAHTDAAGWFHYKDVEVGEYKLRVSAGGYAPKDKMQPVSGKQGPLKIILHPLGTLTLRISDKDGLLLHKQRLRVRLTIDYGSATNHSVTTTVHGIASVPNLIPATYTVALRCPGRGCLKFDNVVVGSGFNAVRAVTLKQGGTMRFSAHERDPVTGKEMPVGGVSAWILQDRVNKKLSRLDQHGQSNVVGRMTEEGGGVVEIGDLLPGRHRIRGSIGMPIVHSQPLDIDIRAGVVTNAAVLFDPLQAGAMDVAVTAPNGKAVVDTEFMVVIIMQTNGAPGMLKGLTLLRRAHTDTLGHFRIYPVPPGDYTVSVFADGAGPGAKIGESAQVTTAYGKTPRVAITW